MTIDYKSFGDGKPNENQAKQYDKRWWKVNKSDRAGAVAAIVDAISKYDSPRQNQYQISAKLYGNVSLMGLNGLSYSKVTATQNSLKDRISYNVIQSAIDTLIAKMVKNKPKPLFLTSGGDSKLQRKAKKLNKFMDGTFYENNAYELGPQIIRDASVFGDGIVHVFEENNRVKYERVIPSELFVDWVEAFYGEPRQLHRVKNVDRDVLIDLFPSCKNAIKEANTSTEDLKGAYQNVADQVTVIESWHLPSGPNAKDGLHTINLLTSTLFEEEWNKEFFPFARMPFCQRMYGYWAQGGAEQIQNIQLEINKLLWVIQRSMHLAGTFKVWIKTGTKLPKEHITNDIGAVIVGDEPPQYLVPPIVAPEIYQHLQTLKNAAYEQIGISQLSASSQKPLGLNSGKALREYNNIESDRFMTIGQSYERFFLQLAKLSISVAKDIYEREGSYKVKFPGKKFIETIDWVDVDLKDDEYVMNVFPVSSLPNDPAGRLQTIQEYMQAGLIDPLTGKRLLDFPDLEQIENLSNAQEDWVAKVLDQIVDEEKYTPPDPNMDLDLATRLYLQYYAYGQVSNLEESKMELLRTFKSQVDLLKAKVMQGQAQKLAMAGGGGAGAGPGAPQAAAAPMPQSDLIANVPGAPGVGPGPMA